MTRPGLPDLLRGDDLRRLDASPAMVAVAVGQPLGEGDRIACVMPGHTGSGWVDRGAGGIFAYRCDCDGLRRSLNEVYTARVTRVKRFRSKQEYVLWLLRRAAKAGLVVLPPGPLPPVVAAEYPAPVKPVYRGLRLFLQVRQLTEQREESTFTFAVTFASEWCDVPADQAKKGIARLRKNGVIVVESRVHVGGGRANTYRLGVTQ